MVVLMVFSVPPDWASRLQWCAQTRAAYADWAPDWAMGSTVEVYSSYGAGGPHAGGRGLGGWNGHLGPGPPGEAYSRLGTDWAMGSAVVVFSGYGTGGPYAGEWGLVAGGSLEPCSPEGLGALWPRASPCGGGRLSLD